MDRPGVLLAAGLPVTFPGGVPATGQVLAAAPAAAEPTAMTSAD